MTEQKENLQHATSNDLEPLDLDVDDQFWEDYRREQLQEQQAKKSAQQTRKVMQSQEAADGSLEKENVNAHQTQQQVQHQASFRDPDQEEIHKQKTSQERTVVRPGLQRQDQQKRLKQPSKIKRRAHPQSTKNLDFEPLAESNQVYVMPYFIYGVFYIFHFMISFKINFFVFPTTIILGGYIGLQKISKLILSRQAMSRNEASAAFAYVILIYFFLYAIVAYVFKQNFVFVGYFYTPNILENLVLLVISVFLGLKFFSDYELDTVLYITPLLAIWIFLLSRLWVIYFQLSR